MKPDASRWRQILLENTPAKDPRVVLFERTDLAPRTLPHVWFEGIIEGEGWSQVTVNAEDERLRFDFPTAEYEGMPARLYLERPKQLVIGSRWKLVREDGVTPWAVLVMKRNDALAGSEVARIEKFYRTGQR